MQLLDLPQLEYMPTARLGLFRSAEPESVTILPTYRCNAACRECCFESNSSIRHRMTRDELLGLIRRIRVELPRVRYVVLSGGEVTLLRHDLVEAIALLTELGLGSRIVSNGHWGRTEETAEWWSEQLARAGLCELNLSTGDEHLEWVPLDSVTRAAYHATTHGLLTLIVVEGKDQARFRLAQLQEDERIRRILSSSELSKRFVLMTNIWMPFHGGTDISHREDKTKYEGCDNIFENYVVNPYGNIMSCCGLTMEYIPEMKVGHVSGDHLKQTYVNQFDDLLKLWIWLDGTRAIFDLIKKKMGDSVSMVSPHPCSICAQIYRDPLLRKPVEEALSEMSAQILFRAMLKAQASGRLASAAALGEMDRSTEACHGSEKG